MISVKCTAQFSYTLFMLNRTVWNRYVTVKLRKLLPGLEKAAWGPNRSMCTDHITQLSHTLSSYKVALDCYVLFFTIVYFYKTTVFKAFTLFFLKKILNLDTDLRLHLKNLSVDSKFIPYWQFSRPYRGWLVVSVKRFSGANHNPNLITLSVFNKQALYYSPITVHKINVTFPSRTSRDDQKTD